MTDKIPHRYIPAGSIAIRDKSSSAVAYIRDQAGKFYGIGYSGRRGKPDYNFRFATAAARESHVVGHFETTRSTENYRVEARAKRSAAGRGTVEGKDYLSCGETAGLIRLALRESFPGFKFSVRSDNNAVRIAWTDGPSTADVDGIANNFCGGYFDGMTDFAGSYYHLLDGRRVSFGAKYVFSSRNMTGAALGAGLSALVASGRGDGVRLDSEATQWGDRHKVTVDDENDHVGNPQLWGPDGRHVRAVLALENWRDSVDAPKPLASPTVNRVQFLGSDHEYYSGVPTADSVLAKLDTAEPTAH